MSKELHHPDRDQIDLSAVLEALSEPTRRDIVLRLLEQGEASCSNFNDCAPKSNLTYHLARLREAGVTRARIEGPYRLISVRTNDLAARFPGLLDAIVAAARSAGPRSDALALDEAAPRPAVRPRPQIRRDASL
jgi:DNA-binding transcriptional ArsR family regulator